jgi:hypothetical protein|tara:strand:- start:1127 stop:1633 length:507 start_codon:yes stop_codon:yes gene_type:complete
MQINKGENKMSWEEFREKGRIVEKIFTQKHLTNVIKSSNYQDFNEHWDVQGDFDGRTLKFDVKGLKKTNRWDANIQDENAWVEGTNVRGRPGWVKGKADYIVFERNNYWLMVNREELFNFVNNKLKENSYAQGKIPYHVYQREGRQDKITLVPYVDIENLKDVKKLEK